MMYTEAEAKEAREDGVDLLEEARLLALSRSAIYQQGLRHLPQQEDQAPRLPRGIPRPPTRPRADWPTPAVLPMAGPLHRQQGLMRPQRILPHRRPQDKQVQEGYRRGRNNPTMERGAPLSVFQLAECTFVSLPFVTI